MPPTALLQSLTIDLTGAPLALRVALAFQADEIRDLLCHAAGRAAPLLVLRTKAALTLLSTTEHHVRAFCPVLESVWRRAQDIPGWQRLRVRIAIGSDAARQLLREAIPETRADREIHDFARDLRAAALLSLSAGAFSVELSALVRMTQHAAQRLWDETLLGAADTSPAELELESWAAERIIEEELVSWQTATPSLRASQRPFRESGIDFFTSEEGHSVVRLRSASARSGLRSA